MSTLLFRIFMARLWNLYTRIWPKNSFSWNRNSTIFCKNLGECFDRGDAYTGGWGQKSHDPWYMIHPAYPHSIAVIAHPKLAWTPCITNITSCQYCKTENCSVHCLSMVTKHEKKDELWLFRHHLTLESSTLKPLMGRSHVLISPFMGNSYFILQSFLKWVWRTFRHKRIFFQRRVWYRVQVS